jgi:hypothetical protein
MLNEDSALQGDFELSSLNFPGLRSSLVKAERKEDISGVGDDLDDLMNVLPGVDATEQVKAQEYADELLSGGPTLQPGEDLDDIVGGMEDEEEQGIDF